MKKVKKTTSKRRKIFTVILVLLLIIVAVLLATVAGVLLWANGQIDEEADNLLFASLGQSQTTRIYAKTALNSAKQRDYSWAEYDFVFADENSIWADYEEIPHFLLNAFVAIEDKRFYRHDGVDWLRTGKAILNYFSKGEKQFGGSTITQQVVKNVCGERDVSVRRKAKEILRALRLEKTYEKDEILTFYANIAPMANACTGVASASRFYFGKSPAELSLSESACLAAITNSPSRYNPIIHPDENRNRAELILHQMQKQGYITEETLNAALAESVTFVENPTPLRGRIHDWFTETVISDVIRDLMQQKHLSKEAATRMVYSGGLEIMSTVDTALQEEITAYFANAANFYSGSKTEASPDFSMVIVCPKTGHLLATAGNAGEKNGNRIQNGITAKHPPGSSLKPIALYLPLLEERKVHWGTAFEDMPEVLNKEGTPTLWPKNSPDVYQGKIGLAEALALSKNTVALSLYRMLGAEAIYNYLSRLDIPLIRSKNGKTDLAPAPLALGQLTDGVSLRTLTDAYTPLANDGVYHKSISYLYVLDAKGNVLLEHKEPAKRICSPTTAYLMTKMLEGVTDYGTARRMRLKYFVDVAGKTGTSGSDKDRWFIGYTPDYLCGIRSSSRDGASIGSRARNPLFIWDECMQSVYENTPVYETTFAKPSGIMYAAYCPDSGDLLSEACLFDLRGPRVAYGYFTPDNRPIHHCQAHVLEYDEITEDSIFPMPSYPFSQPIALLGGDKKEIEDQIKTLDRPYRLWYYKNINEEKSILPTDESIEKNEKKGFLEGLKRFFQP